MKWVRSLFLSLVVLASAPLFAEQLKWIVNPYTSRLDATTALSTDSIKAGSGITVTTTTKGVQVDSTGGAGMTPGVSYYVQADPPSVQSGAFNISSGTVQGPLTIFNPSNGSLTYNPATGADGLSFDQNNFVNTNWFISKKYVGSELFRMDYFPVSFPEKNFTIGLSSGGGSGVGTRYQIGSSVGKHTFKNPQGATIAEFDPVNNSSFTIPVWTSSETVNTQLNLPFLTQGNCLQLDATSGKVISAASPCGSGGGGGGTTIWVEQNQVSVNNAVSTISVNEVIGATTVAGGRVGFFLRYDKGLFTLTGSSLTIDTNVIATSLSVTTSTVKISSAIVTYVPYSGFSALVNGAETILSTTTNFINNQSASVESKKYLVSSGTTVNFMASTVTIGQYPPMFLSNNPLVIVDSVNAFYQTNIQNLSSGDSASGDYIVTNNLGSNTSGYVDLGINGSGYNQASFNVSASSDSYLYASNRSFAIGTADPGADAWLKFFTGGTTSDKVRLQITNTGVVSIPGTQISINGTTYTWNVGAGGAGQFLQNNGGTITSATPAGGSGTPATVSVATGSPMGFNTAISSPVAAVLFSTQTFQVQLQGGATAYVTARSTITSDGVPQGTTNLYATAANIQLRLTNPTTMFIANGTSFQNANFNVNTSSSMRVLTSSLSVVGGANISTVTIQPLLDSATALMVLNSSGAVAVAINTSSVAANDGQARINISTTAGFALVIGTTTSPGGMNMVVISTSGQISYGGLKPTISGCGTTPTLALNITNEGGTVTPGATATGCTVTFVPAYKNTPNCIVAEQTMSLVNALSYTVSAQAIVVSQTAFSSAFTWLCKGADPQ